MVSAGSGSALSRVTISTAARAAVSKLRGSWLCVTSDIATAGRPRKRPSIAAETVPE